MAMNTPGTGSTSWPAYLKDLQAWVHNPSIGMYGRWNHLPPAGCPNCPGEGGVDLTSPTGTPIYALADGTITGAGYWPNAVDPSGIGHGVVTTRIDVPGQGPEDLYYQHIVLDPSIAHCAGNACQGQRVTKGQLIGTTGEYGEVELGFNANWGTIWGSNHPGPWPNDPRPWLVALVTGSSSGTWQSNTAQAGTGLQTSNAGFPIDIGGAISAWFKSTYPAAYAWVSSPLRFIKLVVGGLLVAISLLMLVMPTVESTVTNVAGKTAKIGALFA